MAKKARTTVNAHPLMAEPLKRLQGGLKSEFGVMATKEELVGALILGATTAQLVGMLQAYNRHVAEPSPTDEDETDPD